MQPHNDHFPEKTDDQAWIARCATEGWVAVTKDDKIRFSELAKKAIIEGNARLIVCVAGKGRTHEQLARNFVNSIGSVVRLLERQPAPFIAGLYMAPPADYERGRSGEVKLRFTYAQWQQGIEKAASKQARAKAKRLKIDEPKR